jgi:hypothetical protein
MSEASMLRRLNNVLTRILVLAVLALVALVAIGGYAITKSRSNLFEQKKADVRHLVEAGTAIVLGFEKRADAGEMRRGQAQAEARVANA